MTEEINLEGANQGDLPQDADQDKDAPALTDNSGGMGKGGATHDDFGKDSGIRPERGQATVSPKVDR